jgi:hypothetical protein
MSFDLRGAIEVAYKGWPISGPEERARTVRQITEGIVADPTLMETMVKEVKRRRGQASGNRTYIQLLDDILGGLREAIKDRQAALHAEADDVCGKALGALSA